MKYYFLEIKDLYKSKILKYFIIELILFFYYCVMMRNTDIDPYSILFGINTLNFSNIFESILRLINTSVILFSTYTIYFFDLFRSAEFTLLREDSKSYLLKHLIIILIFNIITILVFLIIFMIIFKNINLDFLIICIKGLINIIYISLIGINIVNTLSYKNYVLLFVTLILLILNFTFISKYMILELVGIIFILIYNFIKVKPQKVYDRFFRN